MKCPYCGHTAVLRDASYVYGEKAIEEHLYVCSRYTASFLSQKPPNRFDNTQKYRSQLFDNENRRTFGDFKKYAF